MDFKLPARKLIGAAAVAFAGLATAAGSADAAVVDTDTVLVNSDHVDFGKAARLFGRPIAGGDVVFDVNNGVVTASVTGRTHVSDIAGTCGRVRVSFLRADNSVINGLDAIGLTLCSTEDGTQVSGQWTRTRSSAEIAKVRVITELRDTTGTFVPTASKTTVMDAN